MLEIKRNYNLKEQIVSEERISLYILKNDSADVGFSH